MPLGPGQRLGRFRILACAGRGGMGEVYKAEDTTLGRIVALKTIRADVLAGASVDTAARDVARFEREARALAAFAHPNATAIFGFEVIEGTKVLCMEWIEGRTVREVARERAPALGIRLTWIREAAAALAALHRAGIIHRDLKPANMMIGADDRLRLLDFGLVRIMGDPAGNALTGTHDVMGTPKYMAPEQRLGARVDGRADQFAWGLVAYELLGGVYPGDLLGPGRFPCEVPPSLSSVDERVPPAIAAIVQRAIAERADDRYPSMDALVAELDAARTQPEGPAPEEPPDHARRPPAERPRRALVFVASAATVLAIGIGAGAVLYARSGGKVTPDASAPIAIATADASPEDSGAVIGRVEEPPDASVERQGPITPRTDVSPPHPSIMTYRRIAIIDPMPVMAESDFRAWVRGHEGAMLRCFNAPPVPRGCAWMYNSVSLACDVTNEGVFESCSSVGVTFSAFAAEQKRCPQEYRDECVIRVAQKTRARLPPERKTGFKGTFRLKPVE